MKFYDCATAPSPRRVRIFIAEKGIDIETVQVDLRAGEQFSDAYHRINPDCVVPALQLDDGTTISEVMPICYYLESEYPAPALFGHTAKERAAAMMWSTKVEQQGLLAVADAFRNSAKGFVGRALTGTEGYAQIPELAERGQQRVRQFYARINDALSASEFLAGDRYSIADISALVTVDFAAWLKIGIPDDAPHVQRWYDQVSARPSASA